MGKEATYKLEAIGTNAVCMHSRCADAVGDSLVIAGVCGEQREREGILI